VLRKGQQPASPDSFDPADHSDAFGHKVRGKTVQVSACREMLNAAGQAAARVTFDDFSQAIIRATPRG